MGTAFILVVNEGSLWTHRCTTLSLSSPERMTCLLSWNAQWCEMVLMSREFERDLQVLKSGVWCVYVSCRFECKLPSGKDAPCA